MVEPEPRHLLAQLVCRIDIAQQAARRGLSAKLVQGLLKGLLQGLLLLRIRNLVGVALLGRERPGDLGHRMGRDRQGIDDGKGRRRQSILRAGMELPLEPAVAAERHELGGGRFVRPPGHPVDEGEVGGAQRDGRFRGHGRRLCAGGSRRRSRRESGRWLRCWGNLLRRAETCAEHQCAERTGKQQDKLRGPCHWGTVTSVERRRARPDATNNMASSIVNDR